MEDVAVLVVVVLSLFLPGFCHDRTQSGDVSEEVGIAFELRVSLVSDLGLNKIPLRSENDHVFRRRRTDCFAEHSNVTETGEI